MSMTLKAARINAGLRQSDVSKSMDIAVSTLIKWEKGITFPTAIQLMHLCRLYGCKLDDIFIPETLTLK